MLIFGHVLKEVELDILAILIMLLQCLQIIGEKNYHLIHSTLFNHWNIRVPQALAYFGVIEYSEALLNRLKEDPFLEKGSELELEIRANSIWSVELVMNRIKELLEKEPSNDIPIQINSILIDFYLWDYAKQYTVELKKIPIHKTETIFY